MAERRRLPVIQSAPPAKDGGGDGAGSGAGDEEADPRPPWQWVGFGTIATFACWLPLAYVAEAVRHHVFLSRFGSAPSEDEVKLAFAAMSAMERFRWTAMQTLPHVIAFASSAFAGGLLVGRFGASTGPREAALSGVVTALIALVAPLVIAASFSWWGGRVGTRKRLKKAA
jgi:hypothetical protein